MITEPAWNTAKAREQLAEMAFEGEKVPALYFGSSGVLSAYVFSLVTTSIWVLGEVTYCQICSRWHLRKPLHGIARFWRLPLLGI